MRIIYAAGSHSLGDWGSSGEKVDKMGRTTALAIQFEREYKELKGNGKCPF